MWTIQFWKAMAERVVATGIEVLLPMIALTTVDKVNWATTGFVVLTACVLAVGKGALAGMRGSPGPSITSVEVLAP